MYKIIFVILLNTHFLFSAVVDHLKPVLDKSGFHQMRNIDFIYMINLDQRPEKFERSLLQLSLYGIVPYRFSAVNGWELSLETINDLGIEYQPWMTKTLWGTFYPMDGDKIPQHEVMHLVGRNYFCHCMSRGAIGIVLSHLSILQDAYDAGYETIWIMEDDIEVLQNPHNLSELIDKLDGLVGHNGWDVLFTDMDTKDNNGTYVPCGGVAERPNYYPPSYDKFRYRQYISYDFRKVGARFGAYSMIVRRSGIKKILDFLKTYKIFLPYDMEYAYPEGMVLYTLGYDVVSTKPNSPSDNGSPNYKNKN